MARRTYIEEVEDPITGEVTLLEADTLEQLDTLAAELTADPFSGGLGESVVSRWPQ